jgi:hypothetical protein
MPVAALPGFESAGRNYALNPLSYCCLEWNNGREPDTRKIIS